MLPLCDTIPFIPNTWDNIFIDKPSQLDMFAHKVMLNDEIYVTGFLSESKTAELKKKFRLFHWFIAYNVIPKKGHYNQVTSIDSFIIYIYINAIRKPLNLNYLILNDMIDVKNHKSRALPVGALLAKVFDHFKISLETNIIST